MRRARPWLSVAVALLCVGFADMQEGPADVPPGPASIRGRLAHVQRPDSVSGMRVELYALGAGGRSGVRRAEADDAGRFVFEGIADDPKRVYLVVARSGELPFMEQVVFAAGELEREVALTLSDPTSDISQRSVGAARVQIDRGCSLLNIRQTHTLHNGSNTVIYVPEADRSAGAPLLEVELPASASGFDSSHAERGMEFAGHTMRYWGPLYPGEQNIEFDYAASPAGDAPLVIGFASGATEVQILSPLEDVRVEGAPLGPAAPGMHGGTPALRERALGPLQPGASVALSVPAVSAAPLPTTRLKTTAARLVLELDDAALDVHEQHDIRVAGEDPLSSAGAAAAPLLCIPLPDRAVDLRISSSGSELGLAADPSGALALYGPLPPGESAVAMHYQVPVTSEPVRLERNFLTPLPRLSVLVTDTGVVPESDRLHPLQPVRTQDRSYLHLEGLSIEPGETVALDLRRLSQQRGMPPTAAVGLVLVAAAGALVFLMAPLRGVGEAEPEEPELSPAALEREAVMSNIRDLDEDFETGKLEAEDHARLRHELRARAVALLRAEREAAAPVATRAAAPEHCPGCKGAVRAGDRFCPACGTPLGADRADGETGQ
jgi:hypothetical protein